MNKRKHQSQTAQRNGAKSKGPITRQGKAASSQNAIKHGLLSTKLFVLPNESEEMFQSYFQDMFDQYQPANKLEIDLLTEMVGARWRLRRLWSIETGLFEITMENQMADLAIRTPNLEEYLRQSIAFQALAGSKSLGLITRYEARIRRSFERALADLLRLQKIRREAEANTDESTINSPEIEEMAKTPNEPNTPKSQSQPPPQPTPNPHHDNLYLDTGERCESQ